MSYLYDVGDTTLTGPHRLSPESLERMLEQVQRAGGRIDQIVVNPATARELERLLYGPLAWRSENGAGIPMIETFMGVEVSVRKDAPPDRIFLENRDRTGWQVRGDR